MDSLAPQLGPPEQQEAIRVRLLSSGILLADLTSEAYPVDEIRELCNIQLGPAYLLHSAATVSELQILSHT